MSHRQRKSCIEVRSYAGVNPDTGRKRTITKSIPLDSTYAEIEEAQKELDEQAAVIMGSAKYMTIGSIFRYYLARCGQDGMSPTTISAYKSYFNKHINPQLGGQYFDTVDQKTLSTFLRGLSAGGLSNSTICKIKFFMSGCFTKLVADGLLTYNPMIGIKLPMAKSKEAIPLSDDDFSKLTTWIDDRLQGQINSKSDYNERVLATILNTALGTGCRRGELAGFYVSDFQDTKIENETAKMLRVRRNLVYSKGRNSELIYKDPKSKHSKRNIALDDLTSFVIEQHLELQDYFLRAISGIAQCDETPLFAHLDGSPYAPDEITKKFSELVKGLGLEKSTHLHTLRHTHATRLLEDGVDIVTLQERLGHESAKTTMDVYGHVMPGRDYAAAMHYSNLRKKGSSKGGAGNLGGMAPICPSTGETCVRFSKVSLDN